MAAPQVFPALMAFPNTIGQGKLYKVYHPDYNGSVFPTAWSMVVCQPGGIYESADPEQIKWLKENYGFQDYPPAQQEVSKAKAEALAGSLVKRQGKEPPESVEA